MIKMVKAPFVSVWDPNVLGGPSVLGGPNGLGSFYVRGPSVLGD